MMFDHPVAVLIGADGYERVISVTEPPPPVFEVAIPRRWSLAEPDEDDLRYEPFPRRTFRLSLRHRSRSHRWWRVYNEGRSQTPEDGYVYLEVRSPTPRGGERE